MFDAALSSEPKSHAAPTPLQPGPSHDPINIPVFLVTDNTESFRRSVIRVVGAPPIPQALDPSTISTAASGSTVVAITRCSLSSNSPSAKIVLRMLAFTPPNAIV